MSAWAIARPAGRLPSESRPRRKQTGGMQASAALGLALGLTVRPPRSAASGSSGARHLARCRPAGPLLDPLEQLAKAPAILCRRGGGDLASRCRAASALDGLRLVAARGGQGDAHDAAVAIGDYGARRGRRRTGARSSWRRWGAHPQDVGELAHRHARHGPASASSTCSWPGKESHPLEQARRACAVQPRDMHELIAERLGGGVSHATVRRLTIGVAG